MKVLVVGGFFGKLPKPSSVVTKLSESLSANQVNGGSLEDLKVASETVKNYDLVLWMADIDNSEEDIKFIKKTGAVLIVSKVLRENRTRIDAVTRIFKFGGNAVIAISKEQSLFNFELVDALGNTWFKGEDIQSLSKSIKELNEWTKESIRKPSVKIESPLDRLIEINKIVQVQSAAQNIRYFGNLSTRCTKMFPSSRIDETHMYVSARNTDKSSLTKEDMVYATLYEDKLEYSGDRKPSVDSPVQLELYRMFPCINYMIHGHAFVKDAPVTEHYYPCGDMREVPEISKLITKPNGIINLKNHGFLIYSDTLDSLEELAKSLIFMEKE